MASEISEDIDPYAKAAKITVRLQRERRTSSPNEIQPMAMVST